MDDSKISRPVPIKTAKLLSVLTEFMATRAGALTESRVAVGSLEEDEASAVELWDDWYRSRIRHHKFCRRQQRLEKQILATVGQFPCIELIVPDRPRPVFARSANEIDKLLPGAEQVEVREQAKTQLSLIQAGWDEADAKIGFSIAFAAENRAYSDSIELAERLWNRPAPTVEGVIAKLHCLIEMEDPGIDFDEPPWPRLRTILFDLFQCVTLGGKCESSST